jgi:hypothetical protein
LPGPVSICFARPARKDTGKPDTRPVGDHAQQCRASGHQLRSRRSEQLLETAALRKDEGRRQKDEVNFFAAIPINGQRFLRTDPFGDWTAALGAK